jgi:hypothetical protein
MSEMIDSATLEKRAAELVDRARQAGADAADAVVVRGRSRSVSVRRRNPPKAMSFRCGFSLGGASPAFRPIRASI